MFKILINIFHLGSGFRFEPEEIIFNPGNRLLFHKLSTGQNRMHSICWLIIIQNCWCCNQKWHHGSLSAKSLQFISVSFTHTHTNTQPHNGFRDEQLLLGLFFAVFDISVTFKTLEF